MYLSSQFYLNSYFFKKKKSICVSNFCKHCARSKFERIFQDVVGFFYGMHIRYFKILNSNWQEPLNTNIEKFDLTKASDSVPHKSLLDFLSSLNLPAPTLTLYADNIPLSQEISSLH